MISLAIATGIAPGVWVDEGEQTIFTAFELLNERDQPSRSSGGPQMRG